MLKEISVEFGLTGSGPTKLENYNYKVALRYFECQIENTLEERPNFFSLLKSAASFDMDLKI